MICYLVRHGKDNDSIRGGWSDSPLTAEGVKQVRQLAAQILSANKMGVGILYTSDLMRAKQTAEILSSALSVPMMELPEFRETNNGVLAGMKNELAEQRYPGLYWSALGWEETYPDGESPRQFYERIADAWQRFKKTVQSLDCNVILVTHGGVIHVIQCIERGIAYSNQVNPFPIRNAEMIGITLQL